jgi:hypothetical protein
MAIEAFAIAHQVKSVEQKSKSPLKKVDSGTQKEASQKRENVIAVKPYLQHPSISGEVFAQEPDY